MIGALKNLILLAVIIVVVNSQANNQLCLTTEKIGKVKQLRTAAGRIHEDVKNKIRNETAVIFLGIIESGKSTVVNYLIGNKLIANRPDNLQKTNIVLDEAHDSSGPQIGGGIFAMTEVPTRWDSEKLPGLGIWDTPGFGDTQEVRDITKNLYINELIKDVKSPKIVLVLDFSYVEQNNFEPILRVFYFLRNLFRGRISGILHNMSVIFTKVPEKINALPVDKDSIANILESNFISNQTVEPFIREYMDLLTKNRQRFGLFKQPTKEGSIIDASYDEGIIQAVNSAVSLPTEFSEKLALSISMRSLSFLRESREELVSEARFDDLKKIVMDVIHKKLPDSKSYDSGDLKKIDEELVTMKNNIESSLKKSPSLSELIELVQTFDPQIRELVSDNCLIEEASLLSFVESMLQSDESYQIQIILWKLIANVSIEVDKTRQLVTEEFEKIGLRKGKEEMQALKDKLEKELQNFKDKLEKELQDMKDNNLEKGLQVLINKLEKGLQDLKDKLGRELQDTKNNILEKEMRDSKNKLEIELQNSKAELGKELQDIKNNSEKELQDAKDKLGRELQDTKNNILEKEMRDSKNKLEIELRNSKAELGKELQDLKNELVKELQDAKNNNPEKKLKNEKSATNPGPNGNVILILGAIIYLLKQAIL